MEIELTSLPGIGTCRSFTSATGRRVTVIAHHAGGRRELIHGCGGEPDGRGRLILTREEAIVLAGLLGVFDVTADREPC
ncbi:potassium transporter TrkA [Dactylosporangium sp. NPDC050688]|uniref:potassium transporter TrkA n=1 Tax=Dactylosporangium sp. NPDC050688 TaxID=3157217 RepID=UPI0033FD5344